MDSFEGIFAVLERSETKNKTSSKGKKRKWREIEALKERHRLKKELEEFGLIDDIDLDDLAI
jgi:hypothetical protein